MNTLNESESILWRCVSRFHDWTDRTFPLRLVNEAAAARIIGAPEWVEVGEDEPRISLPAVNAARAASVLFEHAPAGAEGVYLRSGGAQPHPWRLSVVVQPFDHEEERVDGYNIINIEFARAPFSTPQRSADLINCFMRTNTPDATEFAAIHPTARWESLRRSAYNIAVTYDMMFAGVYWANFLGPGHLDQFDRGKLAGLSGYQVEWVGDRGLFLIVSPNVGEADTPGVESEMLRLTEIFRHARK
jgi:hypothetical protein